MYTTASRHPHDFGRRVRKCACNLVPFTGRARVHTGSPSLSHSFRAPQVPEPQVGHHRTRHGEIPPEHRPLATSVSHREENDVRTPLSCATNGSKTQTQYE